MLNFFKKTVIFKKNIPEFRVDSIDKYSSTHYMQVYLNQMSKDGWELLEIQKKTHNQSSMFFYWRKK